MATGKKWIQKAKIKKGALHQEMGIPQDKKIPVAALKKAAKKGGKEGKRANLAITLKKLNK